MNFKEQYQKEMNGIKCTPGLTDMAFQKADREKEHEIRLKSSWKLAVAAMLAVCIIGGVAFGSELTAFAKSMWGSFTLSAEEEKMVLDPIKPVPFDQKAFIADANTEMIDDSCYSQTFTDYDDMNHVTNLELPGADKIEYKNITLSIQPALGYGQISAQIVYNHHKFDINAMFALDAFHQEEWGYGENEKIKEIYKYAKDKKAYFVDNDKIQSVYYSEGDILFQLFVKQTAKDTEEAKEMLSSLSAS